MEIFLNSETWVALLTLTFLEIVLGIDNIIFISIVTNKLPKEQQPKARNIGLLLALVFRVGLLLGLSHIIGMTKPLFTVLEFEVSGRDLVLFIGGLFLIYKSTSEIHHKIEGEEHTEESSNGKKHSFNSIITQIVLLDIVFSFDSILTAIGLTEHVLIMITAVIISLFIMMAFSGKIADFINAHPSLQILALSFLILIGFMLVLDAFHNHVPKGYIYFAVAFSLGVEFLNMRFRKKNVRTQSK
ncbi:TerC family protein [Sediminitomix flava]|uniref:Putative tellurium resistance membrane protein TerC n=1 Tax=Sediminitomix flava TaxID=379075 RepID=A0A315Z726_SEDFL|nr:TerC family protein [Sediminitomix flava]PWJ39205.1 putative tellurium resistance membrane protein TerC [Sediminitomix flava]